MEPARKTRLSCRGFRPEAPAGHFWLGALDDAAWEVRLKAANALGSLRAQGALHGLVANLAHPISNVRKEVANALGAIGDQGAITALREALEVDRDIEVRKAAQRALEALGA